MSQSLILEQESMAEDNQVESKLAKTKIQKRQRIKVNLPIQKMVEPLPVSDDPAFPMLKGCGILGYRFHHEQIYFLMMRKQGKLDVPGGKVERGIDLNSVDTAVREFNEETKCQAYLYLSGHRVSVEAQKLISAETWKEIQIQADAYFKPLIKKNPILVAQPPAWGVYLVELPDLPVEIFPNYEDEILGFKGHEYQMEWVRIWDFLDRWQLSGRLSTMSFTQAIKQIHLAHETLQQSMSVARPHE